MAKKNKATDHHKNRCIKYAKAGVKINMENHPLHFNKGKLYLH